MSGKKFKNKKGNKKLIDNRSETRNRKGTKN